MDVDGKTLIITGAASGIGRALAIESARRGASLALADIDLVGLRETADMVAAEQAQGQLCTTHRLNVATLAEWTVFREEAAGQHAAFDGIINNAGITFSGTIEDTDCDRFETVMAINFMGTVHGTKTFLPFLRQRPAAFVANLSSVFGLYPMKKQAAYCASKYAIRGFTEVLEQELKGSPISVSTVYPGHIATRIVRNAVDAGNVAGVTLPKAHQDYVLEAFEATGMPPAQAARTILDGIAKKQSRILVGKDATRGDWLSRFFPRRFAEAANKSAV